MLAGQGRNVRTIVAQSRSAGMAVPRRKGPAASTARAEVSKDTLKEGARMHKPARKLRENSGAGDEPLMDKIKLISLSLLAHLGGHSAP